MMKNLFTLLLTAVCFTASSQVEFPWNPDSNGDGEIGVDDLLGMLASFGEPWALPDPTVWAGETVMDLLAFEEELDSIAMAQQVESSNIQEAIGELQQIGDSLQATGNTCYAVQGESNGSFTAVPPSCRHVNVYTGYGSGSAIPLQLPEQGQFVGQSISFFLLPYGNANRTVAIQSHPNDLLSDGATLVPCNGSYCGGSLSSNVSVGGDSNHNKKFVWDGFRWELVSSGAITIN